MPRAEARGISFILLLLLFVLRSCVLERQEAAVPFAYQTDIGCVGALAVVTAAVRFSATSVEMHM